MLVCLHVHQQEQRQTTKQQQTLPPTQQSTIHALSNADLPYIIQVDPTNNSIRNVLIRTTNSS